MNLALFYFIGCIFIACIIIYEAILLKKLNGLLKKTKLLTAISTVEFTWLLSSAFALYQLEFKQLTIILPTLYILQSFMGWAYGFHLLSKSGMMEKLEEDSNAEIHIPMQYTDFTLSFGVVFLILSTLATLYTYQPSFFS